MYNTIKQLEGNFTITSVLPERYIGNIAYGAGPLQGDLVSFLFFRCYYYNVVVNCWICYCIIIYKTSCKFIFLADLQDAVRIIRKHTERTFRFRHLT